MSRLCDRTLYLDDEGRLGESLGDDCFQCNWEWWMQCSMWCAAVGESLVVNADDATALADEIEPHLDEFNWLVLCFAWGDAEQVTTRAFITFLRSGGFTVVDLRAVLPAEYSFEDNGGEELI